MHTIRLSPQTLNLTKQQKKKVQISTSRNHSCSRKGSKQKIVISQILQGPTGHLMHPRRDNQIRTCYLKLHAEWCKPYGVHFVRELPLTDTNQVDLTFSMTSSLLKTHKPLNKSIETHCMEDCPMGPNSPDPYAWQQKLMCHKCEVTISMNPATGFNIALGKALEK